jgi:hypothetical protein
MVTTDPAADHYPVVAIHARGSDKTNATYDPHRRELIIHIGYVRWVVRDQHAYRALRHRLAAGHPTLTARAAPLHHGQQAPRRITSNPGRRLSYPQSGPARRRTGLPTGTLHPQPSKTDQRVERFAMYRYTVKDSHGTADTIDQVLDQLGVPLRAAAANLGRCRWAITTPGDWLHTGGSNFGRPDPDGWFITETLRNLRDNLDYDATQPPLS